MAFVATLVLWGCSDENPRADVSVNTACTPGELECVCDDTSTCNDGRCVDGKCISCPEGAERCPCGPDDACDGDLVCIGGACTEDPCPAGTSGCQCDGETCDDGLTCMDTTCVDIPECSPGGEDCPCDDEICDESLRCINSVCRDCPNDTANCPCEDNACLNDLVCDAGTCREALACSEVGCAPFQVCEIAAGGQDARCLETCEDDRVWNPDSETCEEPVVLPTCAPDAEGSIAGICSDRNRACEESNEGAECGDCLGGFLEEGEACVPDTRATCSDAPGDPRSILEDCTREQRACEETNEGARCGECLDDFVEDAESGLCCQVDDFPACESTEDCAGERVCISLSPNTASRCLPAPCEEGTSWDLNRQTCTDQCSCEGEGLTGKIWPTTDWNGDCICETQTGYFFNTSADSRQGEACDADGDGWTRRNAFEHVTDPDAAVRINARCSVRSIDRVTLVNEFGQSLDVTVRELSNNFSLFEELYETNENDEDAEVRERQETAYGLRRFRAAELNSFTKACVSSNADHNDNKISDLREHHLNNPNPQHTWMSTFVRGSYFVELHTGHYVAPAEGEPHGRYVIAEKSRCSQAFPLGYDELDGPYWTSCSRRRDGNYTPSAPVGYDFQRWNCEDPSGDCPVLMPPTAETSLGEVPPHGLCEDRLGEDPETWRGMNHANQFKCVEIKNDDEPDLEAFELRRSAIRTSSEDDGIHQFNQCRLKTCAPDADDCVDSERVDPLNPSQPVVECDSESGEVASNPESLTNRVGFVAIRYQDYQNERDYHGGCISEAVEWPQLCPGFDPAAPAVQSQSNLHNFGRLMCGCDRNYGGLECDLGCPDAMLHVGGTNPDSAGSCFHGYCEAIADTSGLEGGRSGYWVCADFANTTFAEVLDEAGAAFYGTGSLQVGEEVLEGSFTIQGTVPTMGTNGATLCETDENGNCTGFSVR